MLFTTPAAVGVAAVMFAATGCGGSSKSASTPSSAGTSAQKTAVQLATETSSSHEIKLQTGRPLSRAAWIARGDAICARANVHRHAQIAKTSQEIARIAPQVAGYDRLEAIELSKLVPPTGMTNDWKAIIADTQKISQLAVKAGEYAGVNKYSEAQPILIMGGRLQQELTQIAKRDGFKKCSMQ